MIVLWWVLGILGFLLLLLTVLIIAPIRLSAEYKDEELAVAVKVLGIKYRKKINLNELSEESEKPPKKPKKKSKKNKIPKPKKEKSIREKIYDIRVMIYMARHILIEVGQYLSGKIIIEELTFKIRFGVGDAAKTGIQTGLIWAGVGGVIAAANNFFTVEKPIDADVMPEFNQKMLDLYINGIIRTRVAHIIVAGIKAVRIYLRYDKI